MSDPALVDPDQFRKVLSHWATGVAVVTSMHEETPIGLAVTSFTSVSLDPPLVLFCADKGSRSWPKIEASGFKSLFYVVIDPPTTGVDPTALVLIGGLFLVAAPMLLIGLGLGVWTVMESRRLSTPTEIGSQTISAPDEP